LQLINVYLTPALKSPHSGAHMNGRALGCVWVSAPHNEPANPFCPSLQNTYVKAWPHQPYLCENILTATFILLEIKLCDPME
uniref:Uncharacterized protein n=1 Tax=Oreochromis niloticus TaxID=8128 RepID=A0A669C8I7_ORENI